MVNGDRIQLRMEHKIQKWDVPWYAVWSCFSKLPCKQVVSLIKAENVPANMHKFPPWTQKHNRIDATTSNLQRKTGEPTFVVSMSKWMQRVLSQRFERTFRQVSVQDSWHRSKRSSYTTTGFNSMFTTKHGSQGEEPTHEKIHRVDRGIYIDLALREIYDAYKAACSVSIIKP